MYLYYEIRTGAIAGQSSSPPPVYPGYASIAVAIPPDPDSAYVAGGAVQARMPIDWTAIPADAFVSVNDAPPATGVKVPTASGTWRYRAVGKYQGERTFVIQTARDVEALLIDQVKAANEALVKTVYSQNYGKQKKYSRKQQEVMDFRALTPAVGGVSDVLSASLSVFVPSFSSMAAGTRQKKFRFAMAQAAKRGVTIDVVIGEYERAIEVNETKIAAWEAVELEAIRAIKAATTIAGKRAVYAAINWNWTA